MADKTINYNLTKPSGDDFYDINVHNENMDIVDAELKNLSDEVASHTHTANSLMVKSIGGGTDIKEYDDLNSYKIVGNYICGLTATAQTLSNCPVTSAFVLTVGYGNGTTQYLYQEITHFLTGVKYYRAYSVGEKTWNDWKSTYTTANKPTVADITGASQIVTGSYVGNGKAGSANKNVLSFSFTPKYLYIYCPDHIDSEYYDATFLYGCSNAFVHGRRTGFSGYQDGSTVTVTWASNSVSWYYTDSSNSGASQLNESGYTYYYVAIG